MLSISRGCWNEWPKIGSEWYDRDGGMVYNNIKVKACI